MDSSTKVRHFITFLANTRNHWIVLLDGAPTGHSVKLTRRDRVPALRPELANHRFSLLGRSGGVQFRNRTWLEIAHHLRAKLAPGAVVSCPFERTDSARTQRVVAAVHDYSRRRGMGR